MKPVEGGHSSNRPKIEEKQGLLCAIVRYEMYFSAIGRFGWVLYGSIIVH